MRTDEQWLRDIVEATNEIARFLTGADQSRFLDDPMIQRAVLYDLIIVGEAANRVSTELQLRYPDVNWRGAISMRNFAAHEYFAVTLERVWETATEVLPVFRNQVLDILYAEFSVQDSDDAP